MKKVSSKRGQRPFCKSICFFLGLLILFFVIFEAYFTYEYFTVKNRVPCPMYSGIEYIEDDLRGYAGPPDTRAGARVVKGGKIVYDVAYTKNKYGLRITPHDIQPVKFNPDFKNVIFFGCSFIYGEGVNDNESLPFIFEEKSCGKYKAYNFGFHGYGPQQMLRALEGGLVDTIAPGQQPFVAIYQITADHVARCAFKYPAAIWYKGPAYKFDSLGDIALIDTRENPQRLIDRLLLRSRLFFRWHYRVTDGDVKLFLKVVKKSKEIFENKYNGEFYVLCLDDDGYFAKKVLAGLKKENIKFFLGSQVFGKLDRQARKKYTIPGDGHPNALAYGRIADYLLNNL